MTFNDETEAREAYDRAKLKWNCTLYVASPERQPEGEMALVLCDALKVAIDLLEYAEDVPQRHAQASALSLYFEQLLSAHSSTKQPIQGETE